MMKNNEKTGRRIAVKFLNDFDIPYEDGAEKYFSDEMRDRWEDLERDFPDITLKRMFSSVSPARIQELVARAIDMDPTYTTPPNFLAFFVITLPPDGAAEELADALNRWEEVEYAYIESPPAPPPQGCPDDTSPCLANQFHLDPPVPPGTPGALHIGGIDAEYAWSQLGGTGSGITFVDIEKGWKLDHPDLEDAAGNPIITEIGGVNFDEEAHGTSVLGILAAQGNCRDCRGIAYEAVGRVFSIWQTPPTNSSIADAILASANALSFGDVMLLELQLERVVPEIGMIFLPVEFERTLYEEVRLATALGIVVVEAAGNGGQDLATNFDNLGEQIFGADYRDSGAILVTAADPLVNPAPLSPNSNFGDRVDCFAWGNSVKTLDVDAVGNDAYTDLFDGTSAAAAIVAGAAILVQAMAEHRPPPLNFRLPPFQLRDILCDTGTDSADPNTTGVMPNLGSIITNVLNLVPDVFVRDHVGDIGDPHSGSISASPDVIVRPASGSDSVPDPNTAFGGSATFYDNTLSSQVTGGQDHVVYVRVLNRGGGAATGTKATVYWSPPTTLATPDSWTKIGTSANPTDVPISTASLTVLDSIPWAVPGSGPGQYCFIATIGSDDDPDPVPDSNALPQMDIDTFQEFIRRNNNVALHNFIDVPMVAETGTMEMAFMAPGWLNDDLPMWLEVVAHLPTRSRVWLEGPTEFMGLIAGNRRYLEDGAEGVARLPINPYGVNRFREIVFPAKSKTEMRLLVDVPKEERGNTYEIFARQLYHGDEVGRVTWRLVAPNQIQILPLRFLFSELWNHVRFRLRLGRERT